MTTHELARKLLLGPDIPVLTLPDTNYCRDLIPADVEYIWVVAEGPYWKHVRQGTQGSVYAALIYTDLPDRTKEYHPSLPATPENS